ncbi:PTS sugar transporter subunit IIA [Alkalibaculum sporogenes]|uniref:PTS sugar transporter subunit IIA n=1 Tax=Alkalibaculum sporogenes TaxID=2655001 RepID=UPI00128E5E3C|nr:PTS fructose transporter subunit IIA [Alkalibaculum sporogenes]
MTEVIIVCHGKLAEALKNSAELITGKQEHIQTYNLEHGDSVDELNANIHDSIVEAQKKHHEVIVLTDMMSGSPFNATTANMKELDFIHITGINMPILLEILMLRKTCTANEIANNVISVGRETIKLANDLFKKVNL